MSSGYKRCLPGVGARDNDEPAKRLRVDAEQQYASFLTPCTESFGLEEDVEMKEESQFETTEEIICYGTEVFPASSQLVCSKASKVRPLPWDRFRCFNLEFLEAQYHLLCNSDGELNLDIGILDRVTQRQLASLEHFDEVKFEAVVASSVLECLAAKGKKTVIVEISVNVVGPENLADDVGNALEMAKSSLQHPIFLPGGIRYLNPHWYYPDDQPKDLRHLIGPPPAESNSKRISDVVEAALGSLHEPAFLRSQRSHSPLDLSPTSGHLRTTLKSHQEQGVQFILSREDTSCRQEILSDMRGLLDPQIFSEVYSLSAGGIIADVMGLGKSLTMLSAIMASKGAAAIFQAEETPPGGIPHTKATLIVASSRQLLDVWVSEIDRHFTSESLSILLFHGDTRARSADAFLDCNIVLTTYGTLNADWKGRRALQNICWFRVVLDEAHWIRNQSCQKFKAAAELRAERRWCLTGTPIQNSMEDLRSLLKFLQLRPFTSRAVFERNIVQPLISDPKDGFKNLKILLGAVCLRRNSSCLNLPLLEEERIYPTLSGVEIAQNSRIFSDCRKEFDKIVSRNSNLKKYSILFATILKLRQLCSYGTLQQSYLSLQATNSMKQNEELALCDQICELCSGNDDDTTALLDGETVCPECSRSLKEKSTPRPSLTPESSAASPESTSRTPGMSPHWPIPIDREQDVISSHYSSKLDAVVSNLEQHQAISKSIVFASWRLTLDALAVMLRSKGIAYVQVDGRVNGVDRQKHLDRFQNEPDARVLLMSFETGSVGLTLTAATRVHLVEPHWNPSVEEQAVARAHRMGQTKTVTVVRYIMRNSVEQKIVERQERKRRLARLSLDSNAGDDDTAGGLEDLKFVLDIGVFNRILDVTLVQSSQAHLLATTTPKLLLLNNHNIIKMLNGMLPSGLVLLVLAKLTSAACSTYSYTTCADRIVHWYDPNTGEICDPLNCGGDRAGPARTDVPGCPQYKGTLTLATTPSYLPCWTPSASTTTAVVIPASTGSVNTNVAETTTAVPASTSTDESTVLKMTSGTSLVTTPPPSLTTSTTTARNSTTSVSRTSTLASTTPNGGQALGGSMIAIAGAIAGVIALV
ncbi:hypothetical protein GQ53DRAFT_848822 [Thozetella sp. PMI_491]|nr:hypothetical protein GQ53DRAFT_848822 [Thozetella sp. PMI_491]